MTVSTGERHSRLLGPLWIAAVILRVVTLAYAVVAFAVHREGYANQGLGAAILVVMVLWTGVIGYAYVRGPRWRGAAAYVDLALTNVLVLLSLFVLSRDQLDVPTPSVTTVWASGAVVAVAVQGGPLRGVLAGSLTALVSYLIRGYVDTDIARDTVMLVGVGFVLGNAASTARASDERLRRALRTEAATAERERLARMVHDSVLQVLARVRRRGADLGGEAAELARLAGEQEIALRALVTTAPPESSVDGETDLGRELRLLNTSRVAVSVPATPVVLPSADTSELLAVVREALANVNRHAGPTARAWVLLEDLGDEVVLSVRDDGPGIPPGRLGAAAVEGRMGVSHSMRRRVELLGGSLALETAEGEGTEWEMRVPRRHPAGKERSR
ncbi:MacS family sensor histidine kinase [Actinoalloteichus caeruleus]|uniref:MacS family sensor histidine kinase n=1 Tax=Actinoalloteichus cyanogriseus TaxID=2893586 RepID=UPI000A5AED1E|nr:DUF5931 domain-containing protein [Actinoalloteichus caeruleus]